MSLMDQIAAQGTYALEGTGVSKVYGSGEVANVALHTCDVVIRSGEIVAVVGPSGSGKSTLLHLLSGLDTPTTGTVCLAGRNLGELPDATAASFRAGHIGFVLQRANLIPSLTVRENVAAPLMLSGKRRGEALQRADTILEQVEVSHRRNAFPGEISGGEAQRAAVARACIGEPMMVFADEPTGAIDQAAGEKVMDLFTDLVRSTRAGVMIVTHDKTVAERGDSLLHLLDGRVIEE